MSSFFEKLTKSYKEKQDEPEKEKVSSKKKTVHFKERDLAGTKERKLKPLEEAPSPAPQETEEKEEGQLTVDVYQTEDEIVIKSTIAGVEPEDLDINITNDMVTIRGMREHDEKIRKENYFYQECYWGAFSRSIILPQDIVAEKAEAAMKNGILTIRLPKAHIITSKKLRVKTEL